MTKTKTKKLPTVKKSISLREDVYEVAEDMAEKYFQGNLSAFIGFTIMAYKNGLTTVIQGEHPQVSEVIEELGKKTDDGMDFIKSVLGTMEEKG